MPNDIRPQADGPLAAYAQAAVVTGTLRPVPLVGTSYQVRIEGGLATVTTERRLRNTEEITIEVTMTLPVPVHATLLGLRAQIGDRVLAGQAKRRDAARAAYEGAIDRGKTAVLHEEVLRGVHQISVAHVPPGEEVTVIATWAMPLAPGAGGATLHVPVTVGDVYGQSPLADSDDLVHGGPVQMADLDVACDSGTVGLVDGALIDGKARLRLDAPIQLVVAGWRPKVLRGTSADGRTVLLETVPAPMGAMPLDAAIMVDRSGSMNEPAAGSPVGRSRSRPRSKHAVLAAALREAAVLVGGTDRIDLWQFDNEAEQLHGASLTEAVAQLEPPRGGTEIGGAIRQVLAARTTRDVLLITDGKSYALDVQEAARSGRRFHVILIGEDSLEARVGHLAALTGGQLFVASGLEAGDLVRRAIAAMRTIHAAQPAIDGAAVAVDACIGGMLLQARWLDKAGEPGAGRAVAALSAALALPHMRAEAAAALAEAEGIVCHLTSLVLVDEQGTTQEGLPAQRKVATMTPRTGRVMAYREMPGDVATSFVSACEGVAADDALRVQDERGPEVARRMPRISNMLRRADRSVVGASAAEDLTGRIDWAADPEALRRGELDSLAPVIAHRVREIASLAEVRALAVSLGAVPEAVAIALMAHAEAGRNRAADRLRRAVLGAADPALLAAALAAIGAGSLKRPGRKAG